MKKKIIPTIILFIALTVSANFAQAALLPEGLVPPECATGDASGCGICSFIQLFIRAADIIVGLSGTLALVMFVFGGFTMITAYGNTSRVQWGKNVLIAAVTGLLIVLLAWTLVNLIVLSLYGGNAGTFGTFTGKSEWSGPCSQQIGR